MLKVNFNSKARSYEQNALVQNSASKVLLNLLSIDEASSVLDLGCGPGNVTKEIALLTKNKVLGVDISEEMINEAIKCNKKSSNVNYLVRDSEKLDFEQEFDMIYCNSAFQWFKNPKIVLNKCFNALKANGKIGIQAPATKLYCPNFVIAVEKVSENEEINEIFSHYKNPWFFLETAEEYKKLFESCGFKVSHAEIVTESKSFTLEQVYNNFQSGAENGYLNEAFYSVPLTELYIKTFRALVKEAFKEQENSDGLIDLKFNRIYLTAVK